MTTIVEIQNAIEKLSLRERAQLAEWFNGGETNEWDEQMTRDLAPGGRRKTLRGRVKERLMAGPP